SDALISRGVRFHPETTTPAAASVLASAEPMRPRPQMPMRGLWPLTLDSGMANTRATRSRCRMRRFSRQHAPPLQFSRQWMPYQRLRQLHRLQQLRQVYAGADTHLLARKDKILRANIACGALVSCKWTTAKP